MLLLSLAVMVSVSLVLGRVIKGKRSYGARDSLINAQRQSLCQKLMLRMKHFLLEAEAPMLFSVIIAALLKETGLLICWPFLNLVSGWLVCPGCSDSLT